MRAAVLLLLLVLAAAPAAWAEPRNGFGLEAGPVWHRVSTPGGDGTLRYESAGLGLVGDAQFVVNERWSLVPLLALTAERTHGDLSATASNGMAAFQLRRWWGDWFVGGHLGYYVELLEQPGSSGTRYGPGAGAALGAERPGGLSWSVQLDLPRKLQVRGETRIALRAQLGWRFGGPAERTP
jgi:hypothetical protein